MRKPINWTANEVNLPKLSSGRKRKLKAGIHFLEAMELFLQQGWLSWLQHGRGSK
jgi:hypothetical protein